MIIGALTAAAVVIAFTGALVVANAEPTMRVAETRLMIRTVQPGLFHDFTPLRARVAPKDVVVLDAQEGGRVEEVLVRSGDLVALGQPLIRFRNPELEISILSQQGNLVNSIAQLQTYGKQLEDARVNNQREAADIAYNVIRLQREFEQADALVSRGFGRPVDRDRARDELDYFKGLQALQQETAKRQDELRAREIPRIQGEFQTLNESLKLTKGKLEGLLVRAPTAGRLTDLDLTVGQMKGRGERLGQITPQTGYKLLATVDEYYLGQVREGQVARMTRAGVQIPARVVRVDPQVKEGAFSVELAFEGAEPAGLLTGQTLDGRLSLGADRQALILPAGPFLEVTGGDWIMRLDPGGGTAHRRRIKVGRRNAEQVEVLSGLVAGDRVIVSTYDSYERIQRINIAK